MFTIHFPQMANYHKRASSVASSQETEGMSGFGRSNSTISDRSRRGWTDKEEATLIMAMKDLMATGWKSDNGFKAGYLTRIENIMRQHLPNTDLRVHPHIKSKFTTWKKSYYLLDTILSRSGVGFNGDVNARYMSNKAWPLGGLEGNIWQGSSHWNGEHDSASGSPDNYMAHPSVLSADEYPSFNVALSKANIDRTLEIPMSFWKTHLLMADLKGHIYLMVEDKTWVVELECDKARIWVKHGWRRFKADNALVKGVIATSSLLMSTKCNSM
ncbi:hypothetical protein SASPL_115441 [Salvia splendens]|uniref:Myb/SANT-like domain-containing protein n=1 Tax=Salvia splendens TaxID=180675 RepID=A0A8X8Y365_SALSN|nr:hypothetical protein SASPL_115441 [Salvia splendens]